MADRLFKRRATVQFHGGDMCGDARVIGMPVRERDAARFIEIIFLTKSSADYRRVYRALKKAAEATSRETVPGAP